MVYKVIIPEGGELNNLKRKSKNFKYLTLNMLTDIHPKLPMRDKQITRAFYTEKLGFKDVGNTDYDGYLMLHRDHIEIHFFEFRDLDPLQNYGQVYIHTNDIETLYKSAVEKQLPMPGPAYQLQVKPWGQKEFAVLDPDHNLLTFGESL